jgi:hypothetical protein
MAYRKMILDNCFLTEYFYYFCYNPEIKTETKKEYHNEK